MNIFPRTGENSFANHSLSDIMRLVKQTGGSEGAKGDQRERYTQ